jgi:hypothetical protein
VHVRVAPSDGESRLNIPRRNRFQSHRPTLLVVLSACGLLAACQRPAPAANVTFEWTLDPAPARVGSAILELRLSDAGGHPVSGARLRIEAQMSHPGMAPLVTTASEREKGRYGATLSFAMGGDWILLIGGSLPNGEAIQYRIDVPNVRSA